MHINCKECFVCNLPLWWRRCNTGASEKVQKRYWKILKSYGIEEIEKNTIGYGAQSWVSNMSDIYMIMHQPIRLPSLLFYFAERGGNSLNTPSLFIWSWTLWLLPLFLKLNTFLARWRYRTRHALLSAVYQYRTSIPQSAYRDTFRKS